MRRVLVFEQIVEGGAGVVWALTAFAGGFFFDHHTDRIEGAVVAFVFGRDAGGDGLIALEAAGGIEVFALFAGMEIESALGALAEGIGEILQERAALGAARDSARTGHVDGARTESILALRSLSSRLLTGFFFGAAAGILVSALAIFAVGQKRLLQNDSFCAFGGRGTRGC